MREKRADLRLLAKSHVVESGCWEWQGSRAKGYGQIRVRGLNRLTHRVSYEEFVGTVPGGMCVLHKCDNPCCCNPHHLFLGTNADNVRDKVAKGREARGERHGRAKLNSHQVSAIRKFLTRHPPRRGGYFGSIAFLSRWFGVSDRAIQQIHQGLRWKREALQRGYHEV